MLVALKIAILQRGIRQTRMAIDLGWDPAKLSRIVNGLVAATAEERRQISGYLRTNEADLFGKDKPAEVSK